MNISDLFGPAEIVEAAEEFDSERDAYCSCAVAGNSRPVLVTIDCGAVCTILCPQCTKPLLFGGMEDDFEGVCATNLPLVMTTTVETTYVHDYTYEQYDSHELTVATQEAKP